MAKSKSPTFIHKFQMEDISLCDELIEYFHNNKEYKSKGQTGFHFNESDKISTDTSVYVNSNNEAIVNRLN